MLPKGLPETNSEAREIVADTKGIIEHLRTPPHWPHSQIVAIATLLHDVDARLTAIERRLDEKPRRGRPPKAPPEAEAAGDASDTV